MVFSNPFSRFGRRKESVADVPDSVRYPGLSPDEARLMRGLKYPISRLLSGFEDEIAAGTYSAVVIDAATGELPGSMMHDAITRMYTSKNRVGPELERIAGSA